MTDPKNYSVMKQFSKCVQGIKVLVKIDDFAKRGIISHEESMRRLKRVSDFADKLNRRP
jgi:hypothetical protein